MKNARNKNPSRNWQVDYTIYTDAQRTWDSENTLEKDEWTDSPSLTLRLPVKLLEYRQWACGIRINIMINATKQSDKRPPFVWSIYLFFYKGAKIIKWEKDNNLSTNCTRTMHVDKKKRTLSLISTICKNYFKTHRDLTVRPKTLSLLE